jgi:hypothetical protein
MKASAKWLQSGFPQGKPIPAIISATRNQLNLMLFLAGFTLQLMLRSGLCTMLLKVNTEWSKKSLHLCRHYAKLHTTTFTLQP